MPFNDKQLKAMEALPFFNASAEGDQRFWDPDKTTPDIKEIGEQYACLTIALIRDQGLYGLLGKIAEAMDLDDYPTLREGFWHQIESMALRDF